jgi:hypothetical protein
VKLGQLAHAGQRKRPETFRQWLTRTRNRTFRTGYGPDEPPLTFLPPEIPEETTSDTA